jgi:uncharacterized protein (DUF1800 family)
MALTSSDAAHLLRRTGFGATPSAVAALVSTGSRSAAVDRVCDLSKDPSLSSLPLSTDKPKDNLSAWIQMTTWWLERMRTTPTPLVEKVNLFWHNHFVSALNGRVDMGMLAGQHRTIRAKAFGPYDQLVQAIAVDPAMLVYLDNWLNLVGKPQENFAREVMELFCLGTGSYTQDDVVSMAKAWTGYTLDRATTYRSFKYEGAWHDSSSVALLGTTKSWSGPEALSQVVKGSRAEVASRWITAKMFSAFAYPVKPDDAVVTPIAKAFRDSGLNLMALVKAILSSDAFWSPQARGALVRSPLEWTVAAMQALNLTTDSSQALRWLATSGQMPFMIPDVSGWKQNGYWISSARAWSASSFAYNARLVVYASKGWNDLNTMPSAQAVDTALSRCGITEPSATTRASLIAMCDAGNAKRLSYANGPNLAMAILLSPDFQLA